MLQQTETPITSQLILQRLDRIAAELQLLRQAVAITQMGAQETTEENIVMQLYGALGRGVKDEYDLLLDWERFDDE